MTTAALAPLLVLPVIDGLASSPYATLQAAKVVDPRDGSVASPLEGLGWRSLCIVLPHRRFLHGQYAEHLVAVGPELREAGLDLRVIGIGDAGSARRFSEFTQLPPGAAPEPRRGGAGGAASIKARTGRRPASCPTRSARRSARGLITWRCARTPCWARSARCARLLWRPLPPGRLAPDARARGADHHHRHAARADLPWIDYERVEDERGFQRPVEPRQSACATWRGALALERVRARRRASRGARRNLRLRGRRGGVSAASAACHLGDDAAAALVPRAVHRRGEGAQPARLRGHRRRSAARVGLVVRCGKWGCTALRQLNLCYRLELRLPGMRPYVEASDQFTI